MYRNQNRLEITVSSACETMWIGVDPTIKQKFWIRYNPDAETCVPIVERKSDLNEVQNSFMARIAPKLFEYYDMSNYSTVVKLDRAGLNSIVDLNHIAKSEGVIWDIAPVSQDFGTELQLFASRTLRFISSFFAKDLRAG